MLDKEEKEVSIRKNKEQQEKQTVICPPTCTGNYLLRRPFKKIKLVRNELKGLQTNFPKWREATNQIIFNISFYQNNIIIKVFNYF
jgi:hypothetical protein